MTRLGAAVLAAAWTTLPAVSAWACPACASREGPGPGVFALVAVMIAVPYAVTAVIVRVIRRLGEDQGQ